MKTRNNSFVNGFRIYKATPSQMRRSQKFPFSEIPKGECLEISSVDWPAETKRRMVTRGNKSYLGNSNVASAAYSWASRNKTIVRIEHLSNGNVVVYNIGER